MTADWSRKFDTPITLPRGRQLITLKEAGSYITKLPKAKHTATEWQAAMEALILVATLGGPTMFARIGVIPENGRGVGVRLSKRGKPKMRFYFLPFLVLLGNAAFAEDLTGVPTITDGDTVVLRGT
jgi:hypothetical protein